MNLQEAELATRTTELEIRRLEITKSHEFSKEGLGAQLTDRQNERDAKLKSQNNWLYFVGFVVVILFAFMGFALYVDKDQIALEIIKGLILVGGGYFGGKYHQKAKDDKSKGD